MPASRSHWWISSARFVSLVGEREYHWVNDVTYTQLYRHTRPTLQLNPSATTNLNFYPSGQTGLTGQDSGLRLVEFQVSWKAKVRDDRRFFDLEIGELTLAASSFDVPTSEEASRFNLSQLPLPEDT